MGATFEPIVKGLFSLEASALPVIALFCISVLASLWPAYRASRLEPVHAIRQDNYDTVDEIGISKSHTQST